MYTCAVFSEDAKSSRSGLRRRSRRQLTQLLRFPTFFDDVVPRGAAPLMNKGDQVSRMPSKSFACPVVSETVTITLARRSALEGKGRLFVRCCEKDCQYVDANEPHTR